MTCLTFIWSLVFEKMKTICEAICIYLFHFILLATWIVSADLEDHTGTIDTDYIFGRSQRDNDICTSNKDCNAYCNKATPLCDAQKCYCIEVANSNSHSRGKIIKELDKEIRLIDFGTRRHHIAHFCPNLDVARECIKKCMALGKPAFCGKDHVCYCGHKYNNDDKDVSGDVENNMKDFKDMYEKYFGKHPERSRTQKQ